MRYPNRDVIRTLLVAAEIIEHEDPAEWHVGASGCCTAIRIASIRIEGFDSYYGLQRATKRAFYEVHEDHRTEPFFWPLTRKFKDVRIMALIMTAEAIRQRVIRQDEMGKWI